MESNLIPPPSTHSYLDQYAIVLCIFAVLATLIVILRFWARRVQKVQLALNDYLMIPSLLFTLGGTFFNIYACFFGMKKVQSPEEIMQAIAFAGKDGFISTLLWVLSVSTIRSSVIFLYIHIFSKRPFRLICYSVLTINFIFCFASILADCLICRPISAPWDPSIKGGVCRPGKNMALSVGILNLALDVAVVVMPMPILWRLKMSVGKKVAVSSIFGMGLAVCAITLYRIYATTTINSMNAGTVYPLVGLLASLEALFGTINACLPMLRPLVTQILRSKRKNVNTTSETSAFGSVPISERVRRFRSGSLRGYASHKDDGVLTANDDAPGVRVEGSTTGEKGNGAMGIKMAEIYVRKDVEVQSVFFDERRPLDRERKSDVEYGHWTAPRGDGCL